MVDKAVPLQEYRRKRDFKVTPEPAADAAPHSDTHPAVDSAADRAAPAAQDEPRSFVIQKHAARRLHYDFRLELDGVMLSWAVPKGPSFDPTEKRMAVQVEDHPISYNTFEGTIPAKQYGAGSVLIWDKGDWVPLTDPRKGLAEGKLVFELRGRKLHGTWELVRIRKPGEQRQTPWILFKKKDAYARPKADYDVLTALPDSISAKTASPVQSPNTAPSPLPEKLSPQLATLASGLPPGGEWVFEIKFDGYRLMTRIEDGVPTLITRGGHDWTDKMRGLQSEIALLGIQSGWLDGELVVLGADGLPDFNALQNAFERSGKVGKAQFSYFVFDVPFLEGRDLRDEPLRERRRILKQLFESNSSGQVTLSADFPADAASVLQSACKLNLEGIIAKRADSPYVSRRSDTWLKLKCKQRQEFVIAGYTDRGNDPSSAEVGSLLLGVYGTDGKLSPVGSVGTGWDSAQATQIKSALKKIASAEIPFAAGPGKKGRWSKRPTDSERWVKPKLVAEVSFSEWTPDDQLRHAVFVGLRIDKDAKTVVRERPTDYSAPPAIKVSNPGRIIDTQSGLTKADLVRYYESVSPWLIPHLKGRPCSVVRGPTGVAGELFFQKHADKMQFPGVTELPASLWPEHAALLEFATPEAIAGAAQMNVIEFHTWNATVRNIAKPDRIIFDVDPGEGVQWEKIRDAALLLRTFLKDLGLLSWVKTSGGKGLHVVVPLSPRHDWDTAKGFSQAVVQRFAKVIPSWFVAKSGPANRVGKIFVDYLRNSHGATTAAAYSARSRPGLGVSMPIPWDDLGSIKGGAFFTVATAREYLSFHAEDPWVDYWTCRQTLTAAIKALGNDAASR